MEEEELIRLSKEGNEEAFGTIVNKYKTKVFNMAFSLTYNREVADDLSQEIFIKAYFALPKFNFKSAFGTWLYKISSNHIKDYLRKESRIKKISLREATITPQIMKDEIEKKQREQLEKQKNVLVHQAIQKLPAKYQIILSLRDIQGLSYWEIAKILKLSPGTVDSRLYRARRMLRNKLMPFLKQKGGGQ